MSELSSQTKELIDAQKTQEQLIVPKLGYLKVPDDFRAEYGSPNRYPEPIAYTKKSTVDGKTLLTYVWDTRELEKSHERKSRVTIAKEKERKKHLKR